MRNTAAQCRRALKLQARQTFFLYRRPCLLCAFLLLCVSLAAQFFTAYSGGALFYAFLDVRQLPLDTGLWLAGPELMSSLMTTMGLQDLGGWGGVLLTLRYEPMGAVMVLPLAWQQLLRMAAVNAAALVVTAPLEYGVLAQLRWVLEGRPQRPVSLFGWYADLRLTRKALGVQAALALWRLLTTLLCAAPGFLCLAAGTALPGGESLMLLSTVLSLLGMAAAYGCYTVLLPARYLLAASPERTVRAALVQGFRLAQGRRMEFFLLNLSFLPWYLAAQFLYSVPLLYAYPYSVLSIYLFLRSLQTQET